MSRKVGVSLLVCIALSLTGCARLSGGSGEEQIFLRDNEIALRVINQNYYDARLFARWRNGRRVSIGQIAGFNEETFVFRWEYFDLQVEINLLSVGIHYSPWMNVEQGDELELVIDAALDRSIRIRRP